jgi:hypothetical protein
MSLKKIKLNYQTKFKVPNKKRIYFNKNVETANKAKEMGILLFSDPQYANFRIVVDIASIILCVILFKMCTKRSELPASIISKQNEYKELNALVESKTEEDKQNAIILAKTLPELKLMNSEYYNEKKINEELNEEYKAKANIIDDNDLTQQQQGKY